MTIPSTHLVVISYDDPLGRIMKIYNEMGRPSQISLMIGAELVDLTKLTQNYLFKAVIDKTTFRMSELLKQRIGASQSEKVQGEQESDNSNDIEDNQWVELAKFDSTKKRRLEGCVHAKK